MSQITTEENKTVDVKVEGQMEAEESLMTVQLKLSDALGEYFQNKDIAKEANERNEIIKDRIREYFEKIGGMEAISELKNSTYAKVSQRVRIKDKLDIDSLAEKIQVSKDELKTPFDISMFTSKGTLTPKMISEYTEQQVSTNLSITRLKKKPKDKKKPQE